MFLNLKRKKFKPRKILTPIWILVTIIFLGSFTLSTTNLSIGNIFFGYNHHLYNIKLANFFFIHAAYPITGKEASLAHYQLGRTFFIQGSFQAALEEILKELEIYPENKRSYYMLGLIYGYMNEEEKAIDAFSKFIEWKPDSWAARNDKAWLQFRLGHVDAALETIIPAANLYPENAWAQNTYCALLLNKKNYLEAKEVCLKAQKAVNAMSEKDWGKAYPGNDPRIYGEGLVAMKRSIETNLLLVEKLIASEKK